MNNENKNNNNNNDRQEKPNFKKYNDKVNASPKSAIAELKDGDNFKGIVKIVRRAQPGPVIFVVTDGLNSIDAVTKSSDFDVDQVVELSGPASERAGRMQIEIKTMKESEKDFDSIINENAKPKRITTSIKSERFDKMLPKMLEIATRIRKAIFDNQPIMIRHHNDSDGINSGLAIEMACKGLMEKIGINANHYLFRSPSKAPFYETSDVFRDIILSTRVIEGHGQKKPLVLIMDNGSTPEDVFGMKTLKLLGFEAIVMDHHNPVELKDGKTAVCPYLSMHLNPYMFGFDGQTSAGMLCYEVARFINEEFDNPIMPAIAAISDRCSIPETDSYIENTKELGFTRDSLSKIGTAIDFVAYHLRFDPGTGVFEQLYVQPELVEMINTEVSKGAQTQLQSTLPYLRTQSINNVTLSSIDLEKYTMRFTYPTPGKVIGMVHDTVAEGKEHQAVLSLGYLSDMVIIRATKPVLPVQTIIENLQRDIPEANVDGGGHECAGTIKFVSGHLTSVLENIKQQVRKLGLVIDEE